MPTKNTSNPAAAQAAPVAARPNILWIMTDQHHAGVIGCAGHRDIRTPHLDSLAREGVRFDRAYCNNPICGPSRCCYLTGQPMHHHQLSCNDIHDFRELPETNVAAHFRLHGYQTALIGKGHMPAAWIDAGFEHQRFSDLTDADRNDPFLCHYFKHLHDHGLCDAYDHGNRRDGQPGHNNEAFVSELPHEHNLECWTGNETLGFLEDRDATRPFFVQMSFQRPHNPLSPSPGKENLYDPAALHLPDNVADFENGFAGKPAWIREYMQRPRGAGYPYRPLDEADLRVQMAAYYALVETIDEQIGRVFAHLKATGQWENTVVIYCADHGDFSGDHGITLKNLGIYESIHRIPYIWKWPGGPAGDVSQLFVDTLDLFPSLCELAGLPRPAGLPGSSLPALLDGRTPARDAAFCEWDFVGAFQAAVAAVRDERHRLVFYRADPDDGELYDCLNDPGELHNLWRDPAHQAARLHLTGRLLAYTLAYHRTMDWADEWELGRHGDGLARLIHKRGFAWSEVEPFYTGDSLPPSRKELPS